MEHVQQISTCMALSCSTWSETALPVAKGSVFLSYLSFDGRQFSKVSFKSVADLMSRSSA